jgi:pimeloyl-ACP methyl ester carboxylesterase
MPQAELDDGLALRFIDRGTGQALLLIAGIPAVADDWDPLALPLTDSRRVIGYDNRGSGGSSVTPGPYSTAQLAADAALAHDTAARLGSISAPPLVLTGDDDRVIPGESSGLLRERIPDARLEVIPGAGHLFFIERPEQTLQLLERFLS